MRLLSLLLFVAVFINLRSLPADEPTVATATYGHFPNVDLPRHIPAPAGALSLYADFTAAHENGVPLYLVNRTGRTLDFRNQDGDMYIKLERQRPDGIWERAQTHEYSTCGNSYMGSITLEPNQFRRFPGYMHAQGEKARVRFKSYGGLDLVSNEGDGFVFASDVDAARIDGMAQRILRPFQVAFLPEEWARARRPILPEEQVAALRLLQVYEDNAFYKDCAAGIAHTWETKPSPGESEIDGAKAIRELLASPWPKVRNAAALRTACVEALQASDAVPRAFGTPAQDKALTWEMLASLAEDEFPFAGPMSLTARPDIEPWRPVAAMLPEAFVSADDRIYRAACNLADLPALADELIPNRVFREALILGKPFVQVTCANAFSRRGHETELTNIGRTLSPGGQVIVLTALTSPTKGRNYSSNLRGPMTSEGRKFCEHCFENMPLESCSALSLALFSSEGRNPFDSSIHDMLQSRLAEELERSKNSKEDYDLGPKGSMLPDVVTFVASWNIEDDTPMLRELLAFRGYEAHKQIESTAEQNQARVTRHYGVRQAARNALIDRHLPMPPDLVIDQRTETFVHLETSELPPSH